jgi:PAS domain S-box-containing protein
VRLNIGPRLTLCFVFIILSMLGGDAVVLWQIHLVRDQVERLNGFDQKLVAALRVHTSLLAFHDRLEALADSEDAGQLVAEAGTLHTAFLSETQRAESALSFLPSDPQQDPSILPTLEVIQSSLQSQLDAITSLATAGDWRGVHTRLAAEVHPLESLTSSLVEKVDREVGEEQAQTILNIKRVEQRVFLLVPASVVLTLLLAGTLGLSITRSIVHPLGQLVEGSRRLARGDFQHQVPVSGEDELAHLGQVFNQTARQLRDLYATLQSSEDQLRRVINTIPALVNSTLPDGSLDFVNERMVEYTGSSTGDLSGWNWAEIVHPDDLRPQAAAWHKALECGQPMEAEVRMRRADGEYRWFLARSVPLRDDLGNIVRWYGTTIDIEDRKRAEEQLRQAQADLGHVNRVTTMGELTASLAHEVKQPIAAAVTDANTCMRWLARDHPDMEEARAAALRVVNDATRAAEIISRIRLLFNKGTAERELVDVNEVIGDMVFLLRSEAIRYDISVRTDLAAGLPQVMGDRVQLQQVLMNLMVNSIDAMKDVDGTRELAIQSQPTDNEQILLSVSDTGVGLPLQQADQIFDAFFTTKPHGTGMGLRISRSIVESHGGRLWAAANSLRGAHFYFTLPANVQVPQGNHF